MTLREIPQTTHTGSEDIFDKAHIRMLLRVHNRPGMPNPVKSRRGSGRYCADWSLSGKKQQADRNNTELRTVCEPSNPGIAQLLGS